MKNKKTTKTILIVIIIIAIILLVFQYNKINQLKTHLSESIVTTEHIENFDRFIYNFCIDESFQINRIKFPIKLRYRVNFENYDAPLLDTILPLKKWEHDDLFYDQITQAQIFDNFKGEMRNTKERVVHFRGVQNGRNLAYYFEADNGKWYLTSIVNKNH
ncbi:MAG: DUF4348 domain-containing protein [Urechidicola sp.]|nr:DUF4348 domain-containing protein [Urechidicola sp.]